MSRYSKLRIHDPVPWRTNEVNVLLRAVKANATLKSLCTVHRRSPESIKAKLNSIASDFYFTNQELFKQIQGLTGIAEKDFLVDRELLPQISPIDVSGSPKQFVQDEQDAIVQVNKSTHISKSNEEEENIQLGLCTDLALSILDSIIGSSLIVKTAIYNLNAASQNNKK
jgi:hypothetical protein